ncbi:hypothetical protein HN784_00330 [bacterium]|nr:hypothetical protein [bacterium]MBT4251409.1 hypothetical protein [bacterium]MBT4598145.1 hypothetical protein [bacterium]MBT6754360.1 hypothetical protein [bacterium]MBT7037283.1 hypothetical protein [bacterium]
MKKVIILACVAIILSAFFAVQETSATSYEEWSKDKETQFDEFICETCKEPTEPEPTEPEPTEPEPEVEPEPKSRKKSKCSGSIGNLVWNDANENGVKDGEEKGLDDVKITLKWAGEDYRWDNDDDEELTTHTNKSGKYEFDDLCEGDYKVYVKGRDVAGYTQVYDPDGKPNNKAKVYLDGDNDDHTKADFGYINRSTPATGSGILAVFVAGIVSLLSIRTLKQFKKVLY